MYIPQYQLKNVSKYLKPQKALIIYGPRRCGKTTLLKEISKSLKTSYLFVDGEDIGVKNYLSSQSIEKLKSFIGKNKTLIIDEAQKIKNIGLNIKLMLDNIEDIKVIASGSSSFDLARDIGEPLTGRKFTLKLFPLAQIELENVQTKAQTTALLEDRLIFGSYPEVVINKDHRANKDYLREIVNSYLYKDILELDGVKHSEKLSRLLQLLAFQIGKEVSYTELGSNLSMSKNTAERYLDLLEKSFVIFKLSGFSRNLRKELVKNPRYYFYDNGIRNALINNYNPLSMRDDIGMLWENYIVVEMIKKQEYKRTFSNNYFWRTYDKKEIDLIEERKGNLYGYEIKWRAEKVKAPKEWLQTYKNAKFDVITKNNYLDFII
ncbi:MAG: ATP-binding protein [Elusimicrobia bacterium]|nr:ATP-binding protein [Elusimicrobiota bacterium]MBU2614184.1 ATP-binding protein [Elusimicrobiota bacterium]